MNPDWKWLVIGMVIGYVALPTVVGAVRGVTSKASA